MTKERCHVRDVVAGVIAGDLAKALQIALPVELVSYMVSDACKAAMATYDAANKEQGSEPPAGGVLG